MKQEAQVIKVKTLWKLITLKIAYLPNKHVNKLVFFNQFNKVTLNNVKSTKPV